MDNTKTTAVSGCIIWFVLITFICSCILPVFMAIGSSSSFSNYAIQTTGGWLCPEGTTPQSRTYSTTTFDENGFEQPATGYELECVDSSGEVVKSDPVLYAFIWIGIWLLVGLIVSIVLTFALSVPGGMLVTKVLNSIRVRR